MEVTVKNTVHANRKTPKNETETTQSSPMEPATAELDLNIEMSPEERIKNLEKYLSKARNDFDQQFIKTQQLFHAYVNAMQLLFDQLDNNKN